ELVSNAGEDRPFGADESQVVPAHAVDGNAVGGEQAREERSRGGSAGSGQNGHEVFVRMDDEAARVDVGLEVDGEARNAANGSRRGDEPRAQPSAVFVEDAPGDGEIAVEPGVEQRVAVDLDVEQRIPRAARSAEARLEPKSRRIRVRTDEPN